MKNNAESIHDVFLGYPAREEALKRLFQELNIRQHTIINEYKQLLNPFPLTFANYLGHIIEQELTPFPLTLANYFEHVNIRQHSIINEYIEQLLTHFPLTFANYLGHIYTQTEKPGNGEALTTFSKRRVRQAKARTKERKTQKMLRDLEDAIKVQDRSNISKSLRILSSSLISLPPHLCRQFADYHDPDSFGCKMGPKPHAAISLPNLSIFRAYKFLFNNKEAARWAFNAEKKEFHIPEDAILLNENGVFSPQWRFPEMERSRNRRDTPNGGIIEENVRAFFNIKSRAFSGVRARINKDIVVFHNSLYRMEKFTHEFIASLIFELYFVTLEEHTKMLCKK